MGDRGIVRIGFHDIGHIRPPFFHEGVTGQVVVGIIVRQFLDSEQCPGIFIQINGIIADTGSFEQPGQFRPDLVVPFAVFGFKSGLMRIVKAHRCITKPPERILAERWIA